MDRTTRGILALTLACGIAGGTSLARPAFDEEGAVRKGSFDQPLAGGKSGSRVTASITQVTNGDRFTLRLEDGVRTVEHNGKPVPEDRLKDHDGELHVIGEDGKTIIARFGVGKTGVWAGEPPKGMAFDPEWTKRMLAIRPGRGGFAIAGSENPPPVMLGITMIEGNLNGVQVAAVAPGLPAAEAGVQVGDQIIKLDGKDVSTPLQLREVMMTLKPGQNVALKVRRGEAEEELSLKLTEFDGERLALAIPGGEDGPMVQMWNMDPRREGEYQRAMERIKRAMEEVAKSEKLEGAKKAAIEALEKAMAAVEEAQQRAMTEWQALRSDPNLLPRVFSPKGELFQLSPPEPPLAPKAPVMDDLMEARLQRLTSILEKLDARLEKLEKKLEERP